MKKALLLCGALLALSASVAAAAGINFSWSDCGSFGQQNKTFACTSNTVAGGASMVGSYIPPAGSTAITGEEIVIDLQSSGATLPAWWQFKNAGTCRQSALSTSADFTSNSNCADYWQGLAAGGATAYITPYATAANRARLLIIYATAIANAAPVDENTEYYAFKATISGTKTVGTGACAGCLDQVCLVLNEIKLTQPAGVGDYRIQNPAERNYVTWQGGVVSGGCPAATPTRNATWGSVKSLYR